MMLPMNTIFRIVDLFKKYLPVSSAGFYRAPLFRFDRSDRIAAVFNFDFPGATLVSLRTDEILSEWKSQTIRQVSAAAVVLLVFVFSSVVLTRQLKKLEESERKLNERALMLAENDDVTDLQRASHTWAVGTGTSLGVQWLGRTRYIAYMV